MGGNIIVLNDGNILPSIGLGTWQVKEDAELEKLLDQALESGYRLFDTAHFYQNEKVLGKIFQKWFQTGKVKREEIFVISKLPMIGMWPYRVNEFLKITLQNLGLDYVDLYLIQFPIGFNYVDTDELIPMTNEGNVSLDNKIHLEAVWTAMETEISRGRTKSIGVCNFNEVQLSRILNTCKIPPAILQVEVNMFFQQKSLKSLCDKHKINMSAFSPFGKTVEGNSNEKPNITSDPTLQKIGTKYGKSEAQIILRFLLQSGFIVIPRSTNAERLKENISVYDFSLEPSELVELQGLDKGKEGQTKRAYFDAIFPGAQEHPEYPWK